MQQSLDYVNKRDMLAADKMVRKEFQWAFLIICYKKQIVALRIEFFSFFHFSFTT